mmetsp:Transcript_14965/g.41000  ORF Transcript_14965/g.41000 Transcript_14965/m.41000 type:complete len:731 (+) Transcript_14965:541-2733(+)
MHVAGGLVCLLCNCLARLLCLLLRSLCIGLAGLQLLNLEVVNLGDHVPLQDQRHLLVSGYLRPKLADLIVQQSTRQRRGFLDLHGQRLRPQRGLHRGLGARDRDDASNALCDALLHLQHKLVDLVGVGYMRTTAELNAVIEAPRSALIRQQCVDLRANAHHADRVGVRLAEHCTQAVDALGQVEPHLPVADAVGLLNLLVHDRLNLQQLLILDGLAVREVEAQLVLVHERALLVDLVAEHLPQCEVQHVRGGVVLGDQRPPRKVDLHRDLVADLERAALRAADVEDVAGVLLSVVALELGAACRDRGRVEGLTALLRVARRSVENDAHDLAGGVALVDELLAVVDGHDLGGGLGAISLRVPLVLLRLVGCRHSLLAQCICLRSLQLHVLAVLEGPALLGLLPELLHLGLKALHVNFDLGLLAHQLREVNGEAVAREQQESVLCRDLPLLRAGLELADALVKSPAKLLLLLLDDGLHIVHVVLERRECVTQGLNDGVHQRVEEARLCLEDLAPVPHGTPQDAAEHVAATVIGWNGPICEGDSQRADVVSDHTICHVHEVRVSLANLTSVWPCASLLLDISKDTRKDVSVVVASLVHEHRRHTLEAHTCVDALGWELGEGAIDLPVELHEDIVPDLQDVWVVHVDQRCGISPADAVVVDLCAWAAGTGVAHLPEVVLHVEGQNLALRKELLPDIPSLVVGRDVGLLRIAAVVGHVQAVRVDFVHLRQQLPCP